MTDTDVLNAVQKARTAFKAATTRANKRYNVAADEAFTFYGSTDVEQAARNNTIQRADRERWDTIKKAEIKLRATLADIKAKAGMWADLVSEAL
jgi:hypothetical protein